MHALLTLLLSCPVLPQSTVPPGFVDEVVAGGFDIPTGIAIDPAGRIFVAEKRGHVWIIDNGVVLPTPLIDLEDEVGNANDRGLMGIALDPQFDLNGFVYLSYVVDPIFGPPDEPGYPDPSITFSRLTRYTANGNVADLASRVVLIGTSSADGFVQCSGTHAVGGLRFAADGTLFVSAGDGARPDFVDNGTSAEEAECGQMFPTQAVGALRAQSLDSLNGKILRIDPATGLGLPDNPFFDGDPASFRSRIWARGFRQPFRFTVRPGTGPIGTLYVSDVGWSTWEELNVVNEPGQNFGWPCYEGAPPQPDYQADSIAGAYCAGLNSTDVTLPLTSWPHGAGGSSSTGVAFYDATSFPIEYWGAFFFTDYSGDWIRVGHVTDDDQLLSVSAFAQADGPIDVFVEPATGDLLYIAVIQGEIRRIRYSSSGSAPFAFASADPVGGTAPLEVRFSSDGTYDPDGDAMLVEWDFGDGSPLTTTANPVHTYDVPASHVATLTVTDDTGEASVASVPIQTDNEPPRVQITFPPPLFPFVAGEYVQVQRTVQDPEDGTNLEWDWVVQLIHLDHIHEVVTSDLPTPPPILLESHGANGERFSYRILVTVTDSAGLQASDSVVVVPENTGPNTPPVASIDAAVTEGLAPLAVSLDASASSDAELDFLTYGWDFGDGLVSTGEFTSHIFDTPGVYTVTLTVTDLLDATDSDSILVRVLASDAVAHYSFIEGSGATVRDVSGIGTPMDLTIQSTGAVTWLPSGGISIDSPTVLATAGPATKLLDAIQASQALTVEAWIAPANTTQFGPARILALSQDPQPHGANVVLGQSADEYAVRLRTEQTNQYGLPGYSTPPGSLTLDLTHVVFTRSADWTSQIFLNGLAQGIGFDGGSFANWGNYALALANEPTGNRPWLGELHQVALYDRALSAVEVAAHFADGPQFSPLSAEFTATPTTGLAPLVVAFTDLSPGQPSSWSWSFGDSDTSTEQNPTHTYSSPGEYTVQLAVTGSYGSDSDTKVGFVKVLVAPPSADFFGQPVQGSGPLAVNFTDLSLGDVSSWTWSFGDSSTSLEQNPSHTYATPGVFPVRLTVTGPGGSDSEFKFDYVTVAASDCNGNGSPDHVDIASGTSQDCNANGIPDECDLASGASQDNDGDGVPDDCSCLVTTYCVSAPNSVGPGATIAYLGSTSIAANDFTLVAQGLPPQQYGVFFYGPDQALLPFGNGFLCIGGSAYRLQPPVQSDGTGHASHVVDFGNPVVPSAQITADSTWRFQFWYRDPAEAGASFNLTDGLTASFCP